MKEKEQSTPHGQGGKDEQAAPGRHSPAPHSTSPPAASPQAAQGDPLPWPAGPRGGDGCSSGGKRPDLGGSGGSRHLGCRGLAVSVEPQGPAAARRHGQLRGGTPTSRPERGGRKEAAPPPTWRGSAQPGRGWRLGALPRGSLRVPASPQELAFAPKRKFIFNWREGTPPPLSGCNSRRSKRRTHRRSEPGLGRP